MRIVAGRFRGRSITAPEGELTRPTSDRARESLFNILEHGAFAAAGSPLIGVRVLDGFAGTGALGLEALSRGAAHVTFIENHPVALRVLKDNIKTFGVGGETTIIAADACRLKQASLPAGLALLDPPYGKGLGPPALEAWAAGGWLAPDAIVVVELAAKEPFEAPPAFTVIDERTYGAAKLVFTRYSAAPSPDRLRG